MNGRTDLALSSFSKDAFTKNIGTTVEKVSFILLDKQIFKLLDLEIPLVDRETIFYQHKECKTFFIKESKGIFEFCTRAFTKMTFIHELQNLFFSLTERELGA